MKIIQCIAISFAFAACSNNVNFSIQNKSGTTADSVIISNGIDTIRINALEAGKSETRDLHFSPKIKQDGSYKVTTWASNVKKDHKFGYYSNGTPSNSGYNISIEKDTLVIINQ